MQQQLNNKRVEEYTIGDKVYVVIAEEAPTATETPFTVLKRIIRRNAQEFIEADKQKRICCFDTDITGGKKVC